MRPTDLLRHVITNFGVHTSALCLAGACLLMGPGGALAQFDDPTPPSRPQGAGTYAGMSPDEALNKALEVVTDLEESERNPDEVQEERADYIETMAIVDKILEIDPMERITQHLFAIKEDGVYYNPDGESFIKIEGTKGFTFMPEYNINSF